MVTPLKICYELNIEANNILTGIATGFLFDAEDDEKAKKIQNDVKTNGIAKTVSTITGILEDDTIVAESVKIYKKLKAEYRN